MKPIFIFIDPVTRTMVTLLEVTYPLGNGWELVEYILIVNR